MAPCTCAGSKAAGSSCLRCEMSTRTRSLIVWGTSSGAGKSLLSTALCRVAARRGIDVAPFKAQNMSNNARVVEGLADEGAEIGSAQYLQALAAKAVPTVDMNPVLLKPERDTASQVVVHGRVQRELGRMAWHERSLLLADQARESFERLAARHALLVIEGAGSPAEINLAAHDYVNLGTARWARDAGPAQALLVTDIDRGGAFAHLHGTWALLPDDLRPLLRGYVLNKFRGDETLLAPGPQQLQQLTGVPLAAVLPMWREHGLPDEDGLFDGRSARSSGDAPRWHWAIVAAPGLSNLDEFAPLARVPGLRLTWARNAAALEGVDCVVLPGSKQVSGDLRWLQQRGLAAAIERHVGRGGALLGICGGLQLLGRTIDDPEGLDGEAVRALPALNLLPLHTAFAGVKRLRRTRAHFGALRGPWQALSGLDSNGYEIRIGHSRADASSMTVLQTTDGEPIGWQQGPVLALTLHGLFESPAVLRALFGATVPTLDATFDGLADWVEDRFDRELLQRLLGT